MLIELAKQYPTISIIVLIVIIILVGIIVFQGRSIKLPWLEIGSKNSKKPESEKTERGQNQKQNQTQNVQIYTGPAFTKEQMEEVSQRVFERIQAIQKEAMQKPDLLYNPPKLSPRIIYIYTARYDFKNKLAEIVENFGGGWAGISLAGFDSFFDKASTFQLIPDDLVNQINDFNIYVQQFIESGDVPDEPFAEIQLMAANISKGLDDEITHMVRNQPPSINS